MSMGYDEDDPRGQQFRDNMAKGLFKLQPGQRPNTNGYGPQPNARRPINLSIR